MTPEAMAELHARAFERQSRSWSVEEFTELTQNPQVFAVGDAHAFALGRVVVGDAELLTLATDPAHRRKGLANAVLQEFEAEAARRCATVVFLEVAENNAAALSLYRSRGYHEMARRAGYYTLPGGRQHDALILQKQIG